MVKGDRSRATIVDDPMFAAGRYAGDDRLGDERLGGDDRFGGESRVSAPNRVNLTNEQKAAVLLVALSRASTVESDYAAGILRALSSSERAAVARAISEMGVVGPETVAAVLEEFRNKTAAPAGMVGGPKVARELVELAFGTRAAADILSAINADTGDSPFSFLRDVRDEDLVVVLADESPRIAAIVLAHASTSQIGAVVTSLADERMHEVVNEMAALDSVPIVTLRRIAEGIQASLKARFGGLARDLGGKRLLGQFLAVLDQGEQDRILGSLDANDPGLAAELREQFFVFEDIARLDDRAMQKVLRQVNSKTLAVALKGTSASAVRERVLANMSSRAGENFKEEMEILGPQRATDVNSARSEIVKEVKGLQQSGEIDLRFDDDLIE